MADDARTRALAALRASAQMKDGVLKPAWTQVERATNIPRGTLVRWWEQSQLPQNAPVQGEVVERAAVVVQAEVEESIRDWMRPALKGFRKMVSRVTSDEMVAEVEALVKTDPEAATRIVVMVGKILEAAPVIARLGDDGAPRGGTGRLDEVRQRLMERSAGRALLGG